MKGRAHLGEGEGHIWVKKWACPLSQFPQKVSAVNAHLFCLLDSYLRHLMELVHRLTKLLHHRLL